jgi:hypothetical protein
LKINMRSDESRIARGSGPRKVGGQRPPGEAVWISASSGILERMDERAAQFFLSVGRLCADARIGGLSVRLRLAEGEDVVGVPYPPPQTDGPDEVDGIGYADSVTVDGVAVTLSDVVEATVCHPGRG